MFLLLCLDQELLLDSIQHYLKFVFLFLINILFDKIKKSKDHFMKYLIKNNISAQQHYIPIYKFKIYNKKLEKNNPEGNQDPLKIHDVIVESAISTICDHEDSVAAVDAEDKVLGYKNWLQLMKGTLNSKFKKKGKIITKTNNSGGILGGISNGMPITIRIAFKPASSIAQKQSTVDIKTKKDTILQVKGRHDPCVVPRAPPVVDSLVALTLADHALLAGAIKPVL